MPNKCLCAKVDKALTTLVRPKESAKCHQTLSSRVEYGHETTIPSPPLTLPYRSSYPISTLLPLPSPLPSSYLLECVLMSGRQKGDTWGQFPAVTYNLTLISLLCTEHISSINTSCECFSLQCWADVNRKGLSSFVGHSPMSTLCLPDVTSHYHT